MSQIPTTREGLSWLFTAYFEDGSSIEQDIDDTCHSRNDGTGSAFTDVLTYGAVIPLIRFDLHRVDDENNRVGVDLVTGLFDVRSQEIHLANQYFEPDRYPLELVYFRESRAEMVASAQGDTLSKRTYVNRYFIGWQCKVNGKNKQVTLAVE